MNSSSYVAPSRPDKCYVLYDVLVSKMRDPINAFTHFHDALCNSDLQPYLYAPAPYSDHGITSALLRLTVAISREDVERAICLGYSRLNLPPDGEVKITVVGPIRGTVGDKTYATLTQSTKR